MGAMQSHSEVIDISPGPSTSKPTETVDQLLSKLPQLTLPANRTEDSVWEDLRRLSTIRQDPCRTDLEESFVKIWTLLEDWKKEQEKTVHQNQSQIHALLNHLRQLSQEVEDTLEEEGKQCEKLKTQLTSLQQLKARSVAVHQQLLTFSRALNDL